MHIRHSKLYDVMALHLDYIANSNAKVDNVEQIECHAPYHLKCRSDFFL